MRYYFFLLLMALFATIACAPPAEESTADKAAANLAQLEAYKKASEELGQQWDAAIKAGDYEAIASLFTEDGIWMPPDVPAAVGKEAIRFAMQSEMEKLTRSDSKSVTKDIRVGDDFAAVWGTFEETIQPKTGGDPVYVIGKWMEMHQQQPDGSWKIWRSIWNRDAPLPEGLE